MDLHVLQHHFDADANLYRLEVGIPLWGDVPMLDEHGAGLEDDQGQPMLERKIVGYDVLPDYVWHADDERWAGREMADIAAEQRQIVTEALNQQVNDLLAEEERRAAAITEMPRPDAPDG